MASSVASGPPAAEPARLAPPCIVCGAAAWAPHFRALLRCGDCGFVRANLELSHDEVKRLYRESYFQGEEYGDYLSDLPAHRKTFADRLRAVTELAPEVRSLFEVGCAYGFWLERCARKGIDCAGVDVCAEAVAYAVNELKQNATAQDFLELPLAPGRYQAFCMWDTIEHLPNPERFVARVHELLPPGGWLFLTTGDIGSRMARLRGHRWRMIHPPTHLQYFSRDTMTRFLARHGLGVVSFRSAPMYRTLAGTFGMMGALGKGVSRWAGKCLGTVLPGLIQRRGFWLDLGDIMFVAARKAA